VVPKDFSRQLHTALLIYVVFRFLVYGLLFFLPYHFRLQWRKGVLYFSLALITFLLLLNAVSEWFFWKEFYTRYNFIAVDYLVYTTEVLGNISESYPLIPILVALVVLSVLLVILFKQVVRNSALLPLPFIKRSLPAIGLLLAPLLVTYTVRGK